MACGGAWPVIDQSHMADARKNYVFRDLQKGGAKMVKA